MILWMSVGTMDAQAETLKAIIEIQQQIEERATELAVADRNKVPAPGNDLHPVYFIEQFSSHNFHISVFFCV
jgi:hypothetical protein